MALYVALVAAALLCASGNVGAFSPRAFAALSNKYTATMPRPSALAMADTKKSEVASRSGREDCEPEEGEYCVLDKKTGKLIKLTIEEKERIFLDALQVCTPRLSYCRIIIRFRASSHHLFVSLVLLLVRSSASSR